MSRWTWLSGSSFHLFSFLSLYIIKYIYVFIYFVHYFLFSSLFSFLFLGPLLVAARETLQDDPVRAP